MAQDSREQRRRARGTAGAGAANRIEATYIKSSACRVIHVDGAHGGLTPQLNVYMALFSEHVAPPESAIYVVDRAEKTAREQPRPPSNKWVREIETEVIMSREVARLIRDWIDERLNAAEKLEADPNATILITKPEGDTGQGR